MGRSLSTSSKELTPTPTVQVRGEKGQFFQGKLLGHKTSQSKYKKEDGSFRPLHIFEFAIEDTDMDIQIKDANGEYVPANIKVGDTVAIFPPTRLTNALLEANVNDTVRFVYQGLGRAGRKGGKPHTYTAEVL